MLITNLLPLLSRYSLGFDLSENTALTFGWRELGVDDLRDEEFIEDFGSRVPYVGFALRF